IHREENATLGRLEAVTHVWQRAGNDHGHRVIKEGVLDFVGDIDLFDLLVGGEQGRSTESRTLATGAAAIAVGRNITFVVWHNSKSFSRPFGTAGRLPNRNPTLKRWAIL